MLWAAHSPREGLISTSAFAPNFCTWNLRARGDQSPLVLLLLLPTTTFLSTHWTVLDPSFLSHNLCSMVHQGEPAPTPSPSASHPRHYPFASAWLHIPSSAGADCSRGLPASALWISRCISLEKEGARRNGENQTITNRNSTKSPAPGFLGTTAHPYLTLTRSPFLLPPINRVPSIPAADIYQDYISCPLLGVSHIFHSHNDQLLHFKDEKTEALRNSLTAQGHTARKHQSQDANPGRPAPEPMFLTTMLASPSFGVTMAHHFHSDFGELTNSVTSLSNAINDERR